MSSDSVHLDPDGALILGGPTPGASIPGASTPGASTPGASTSGGSTPGESTPGGRVRVSPDGLVTQLPVDPSVGARPDSTSGPGQLGAVRLQVGQRLQWGEVRLIGLPGAIMAGISGRTAMLPALPESPTAPMSVSPALLEAVADTDLDLVLLTTRHASDPTALAHALAALRRVGALTRATRLILPVPTQARLSPAVATGSPLPSARRLGAWGVELIHLNTAIEPLRSAATSTPSRPTLVLGAASSGKSAHAEDLLAAEGHVLYLATGALPDQDDHGWAERVRRHQERRPSWWQTLEDDGRGVSAALRAPGGAVLVDSIGSWLTAALTRSGAWQEQSGWRGRLAEQVEELVAAWSATSRRVVAVSEETGWGVVPATRSGMIFREQLGAVNQRLAATADTQLVVAGAVTALEPW